MATPEAPIPSSKLFQAAPKTTPTLPEGYKIVRVRKPDGTIVKVRRPITKTADPSSMSALSPDTKITEKVVGGHEKPKELAKVVVTKTPSPAAPSVVVEKPSGSKEAPKKEPTPAAHASKLETTAKGYRLFHRFHRVHHHASRLVEAFDPYSDIGDLQDGDEYMGSDDDYNSTSDSDDEDRNGNKQSTGSGAAKGATTGAHMNVNVGGNTATHRATPAPKQAKTDISVQEIQREKGSSTDTDLIAREKELLDIKDVETVKAHPPRRLIRRSADWARLIVWALVIIFPLLFIALAIATAALNHKRAPSTYGDAMIHITKAGVTIWPIVFAAVLAQTLKAIATYRVERGIRLMTLEQLISSHSVASALKQPFVLRGINWLTIALLALWSLSPLGSQAMQYTWGDYPNWDYNTTDVYYLNTAQDNVALQQIFTANDLAVKDSFSDSMAVLFAAVFQPISEYQPFGADPWGNPLVPVYETLEALPYAQKDPKTGGLFVLGWNATDNADLYSSFYGIPITQLYGYENVTYEDTWHFAMRSSYLHLDCPHVTANTSAEIDLDPWNPQTNLNGTGSLTMDMVPPTSTNPIGKLFFRSNCSETVAPNGNLTYAYAVCNLTQTFVDSTVSCQETECSITSVLKVAGNPTSMYDFVDEFLKASDVGLDDYPDLGGTIYSSTELYLRDPYNVTTPPGSVDNQYCDIPSVGQDEFTKRLAYLLNTFYSTGFTTDYEFGELTPNQTVQLYEADGVTMRNASLTSMTEGTTKFQDPHKPEEHVVDWVFLAIFLFCGVALLAIGVTGVLLELRTISPDILGFASSVARHSKYVKLPPTDGTMSGAEKARLLGDARVMMQDVRPNAEVGKIVLGTASNGAERLKPGRLYR